MLRGQGYINHRPIDIFRCMNYKKMKPEWDLNNDKSEFVKKVGANGYILYTKSKSKLGISARDFLSNFIVNIEPDGTLIVVVCTQNVDFTYP